jgi:polysaccharide biosynthesis/export protein
MVYRVIGVLVALVVATAAQAQTEYRLGSGDTIRIEVLEDPSLNREVLVLPDGSFSFPLAGAVSAGGRTTTQIESALASALSPNFATSPTISVSVSQLGQRVAGARRQFDIYMMGEVQSGGGLLQVDRGTTVLQALALSGGFTRFAATKRIQLRRTDPRTGSQTVYNIDYRAIEQGATNIGNTVLADGDVIIVPERRLFE